MTYVNKNMALHRLKELVEQNLNSGLSYMPKSFNEEQQLALELFQKRIYLEEIIEEAIAFNKSLLWNVNKNTNLSLTTTAEELINVFKLRSEIYAQSNYSSEIPDKIEGLNFDIFDTKSAIIYYGSSKELIGTTRVIFDSNINLPSEEKYSFDNMRKEHGNIAEVSRLAIKHKSSGLNLGFKYLMKALYHVFNQNNLNMTLFGIKKEHYKLYSKMGGVNIVDELDSYGSINVPFLIMSWDLSKTSKFFNRSFLK